MPTIDFRRVAKVTLTLIALVVLWELVCRIFAVRAFLIPAPSQVWMSLQSRGTLFVGHTTITLFETVAGFAIAVIVGVFAAAFIVLIPRLRDVLMPVLLILQLVPKVAVAPLLLIWFGYGLLPKVMIAFLVAFFPIIVNTTAGLASVERELIDLGRSLETNRWQMFWRFQIPSALPEIFSGMKVAVTLAIIGAIIGEFVGGNGGLGYLIVVANQELDTPLAFAAILLLSAMGMLLYGLIELAERLALPWHVPSEPFGPAGGAP